ncbi:hypothetical protein [Magnetovibrio sp.]|uniref:hypothetical protein n=1 Tax=Magnetovibrio sp. TaxID=2024836 RepID=UPI002F9331A1
MARKSSDAIANSKMPYGRDAIWAAIRTLHKRNGESGFTRRDIYTECGYEISRGTIQTYTDSLTNAGIIAITDQPGQQFQSTIYLLVKDVGAEAPRIRKDGSEVTQGLGTEAMWRTMKALNAFTAGELCLAASTSKAQVSEPAALDYLKFMRCAGYIREVSKGAPGKPARYAFIRSRDPGPKPPQIQRVKQVFDPNSKTVVWPKPDAAKGGAK